MQLTLTEQHYLALLAEGMNFEEMAVELGWTAEVGEELTEIKQTQSNPFAKLVFTV